MTVLQTALTEVEKRVAETATPLPAAVQRQMKMLEAMRRRHEKEMRKFNIELQLRDRQFEGNADRGALFSRHARERRERLEHLREALLQAEAEAEAEAAANRAEKEHAAAEVQAFLPCGPSLPLPPFLCLRSHGQAAPLLPLSLPPSLPPSVRPSVPLSLPPRIWEKTSSGKAG